MVRQFIAVTIASLACFLAGPASAQDPSYAQSLGDAKLSGTIVRFAAGAYDLALLDDRGFVDRIELHRGTILVPIGVDLRPGMRVSVTGYNAGSSFVANEIARDRRPAAPTWYDRWVAPRTAGAQNPPAPPIVNTPFP